MRRLPNLFEWWASHRVDFRCRAHNSAESRHKFQDGIREREGWEHGASVSRSPVDSAQYALFRRKKRDRVPNPVL